MNNYGEILKGLRKEGHVSQEKLAKHAGITKSTISKYEKGEIVPTLEVAKLIADFFGITVDEMTGSGIATSNTINERNSKELYGMPYGYIKAIRLASNNGISPEELINLINATSTIISNRK